MNHQKSKLNLGNLLVYVACFIIGLSVFLPYVSFELWGVSDSLSLIYYDGIVKDGVFILILVILTAIFNTFKNNIGSIVCAIILVRFTFKETLDALDLVNNGYGIYSTNAGFITLIIGTVLLIVFCIVAFLFQNNEKKKSMETN